MEGSREDRRIDSVLKAVLPKADEDHLRVALIKPGSSRYLRNEVVMKMTKRVEPRKNLRPLQYLADIARDFLLQPGHTANLYQN